MRLDGTFFTLRMGVRRRSRHALFDCWAAATAWGKLVCVLVNGLVLVALLIWLRCWEVAAAPGWLILCRPADLSLFIKGVCLWESSP